MFSYDLWNKYDAVLAGTDDLTNNKSEAWNSVSKIGMPMKSNVYSIQKLIRDEEALAQARFHAALSGGIRDQNPGRTKKRLEMFKSLRQIVEQYNNLPNKMYLDDIVSPLQQ